MKDGKKPGDKPFDSANDERLTGKSWVPPQSGHGTIDGGPRNGMNYLGDTYYAAGTGLGRRIRGFRGLYDMSKESLATQMKVPEIEVAAWESGKEQPSVLQLCLLCDVFRTTPNALLMGPFYVQEGPLRGLGHHLETLPGDAQMAILFIARLCYKNEGKEFPETPYL